MSAVAANPDDFWVFGYGSLMWRPGFEYRSSHRAQIYGFHRALCVYSYVHRGTPERPGLVLGLDRGGTCIGLGFRVEGTKKDDVLAYLRAREQVTKVYVEKSVRIHLDDGSHRQATTYVAAQDHEQYAGRLSDSAAAQIVKGAAGQSGANPEYVHNTLTHLQELGLRDHHLESIAQKLAG